MQKYKVLKSQVINGTPHRPGMECHLSEADASRMILKGIIAPVAPAKEAKAAPKK